VLAQGAHLGEVLMLFAALAYSLYGELIAVRASLAR